jgi:hypothetical protein
MSLSHAKAAVLFFSPQRGGRPCVPVLDGYAPYIRSKVLPVDLAIRVNGMPVNGKYETSYNVTLEFTYHPKIDYSALVSGLSFQLVEGLKHIGEGTITSDIF